MKTIMFMSIRKEKESVNGLYTDFRSDVTAAAMVDNDIEADSILVLRRRSKSRRTDKEIDDITRRRDHENGGGIIEIRTNRPGIYDNLPEYLFHSGLELKQYSRESVMESLHGEQKAEDDARRLFSLFEAEIEHVRMELCLKELRHDRPVKHRASSLTVGIFWPVVQNMDLQTAILFTHAIQYMKNIRGSEKDIAFTLAAITGLSVAIKPGNNSAVETMKSSRLATVKLGVNSVLKQNSPAKNMDALVTVGEKSLLTMLSGGATRRIMEGLLELFISNESGCRLQLRPLSEAFNSHIGKPDRPCLLGINARLGVKLRMRENERE